MADPKGGAVRALPGSCGNAQRTTPQPRERVARRPGSARLRARLLLDSGGYPAGFQASVVPAGRPGSRGRGLSLETWLLHELRLYNGVSGGARPISFYRTGAGVEVDFVIEVERKTSSRKASVVLLEVKASRKWDRRWGDVMRALAPSRAVRVQSCFGVYLGKDRYRFGEVEVLPVGDFLERLFAGRIY